MGLLLGKKRRLRRVRLVPPFVAGGVFSVGRPFFGLKVRVHEMSCIEVGTAYVRRVNAREPEPRLTCGISTSEKVGPACHARSLVLARTWTV